jgi:microcystin-dependent protein
MAFLNEQESYPDGVYQIEEEDDVLGGPTGIANKSLIDLANRTKWLKARVMESLRLSGVKGVTGNYGIVADDVGKVLTLGDNNAASFTLPPLVDFVIGNPITINIPATYPANVPLVSYIHDVIEDSLGSGLGVVNYPLKPGTRIVITPTAESWVVVFKTEPAAAAVVVYGYLPGDIATSASPSAQRTGFLLCDGSVVSRGQYPDLFAAIGTYYGIGDGVSTFSLPDFRGLFLRGWSAAGANDPGRVFGSFQADAIIDHSHSVEVSANGSGSTARISTNGSTGGNSAYSTGKTGGSTETRPKNQTVNYFIKY